MRDKDQKRDWKFKLHEIIYEADTPTGKLFDVVLLITIIASIIFVMLESVKEFDAEYHNYLNIAEWVVTIIFSIEYILRIISVKKPWKYIFSFYGIIDFLSTIPKYLSLIFMGTQVLIALRALRLLRVFRILKLARYVGASNLLANSLKASRAKILVFLFTVLIISVIFGTVMYFVEGDQSGFTSIPVSVYWSIVTLTTVGFGDIAPVTPLGQFIASMIMILGYGIIAVPTGIVSAEYAAQHRGQLPQVPPQLPKVDMNTESCPNCSAERHKDNAKFCYNCGHILNEHR
ncbi:voltage-gated potassium channel [Gelidibacter sediminis]|uniref:Voltage-gated potassium channel n=1 Tax=Gelidibacter sediminis TaxID=1608710 RepID=A0A4R7PZS8_9FLAO|nr:ion transporter [Gelidibacter sediminis]TDU40543.1 voltage-gated potassium channel [Gelidibacter sediminis]